MKTLLRFFLTVSLVIVCFNVGSFSVIGGAFAEVRKEPKLVIENPVYDFGTVVQGFKVSHDFTIKNTGNQDLVIQKLVPGCGCTAATSSAEPIKPGEAGVVHVEFDTSGFSGEKLKTVRIYSNDFEAQAAQLITVKGIVQPDVTVEPMLVSFDEVVKGTPLEEAGREVTVTVREGSSIQLLSVKSFSPQLVVKELQTGPKELKFIVGVSPLAVQGEIRDRVVVSLKGGKESVISIPVYAKVRGKLSVKPAQLSFGIIEGKDALTRSFRVDNAGKEAISIRSVKSMDPAVSVDFKTIQAGKLYVVHVTVDPDKVKKNLKTSVEVTTDSSDESSLLVNVYGVLPPKVKK